MRRSEEQRLPCKILVHFSSHINFKHDLFNYIKALIVRNSIFIVFKINVHCRSKGKKLEKIMTKKMVKIKHKYSKLCTKNILKNVFVFWNSERLTRSFIYVIYNIITYDIYIYPAIICVYNIIYIYYARVFLEVCTVNLWPDVTSFRP